MGNRDNQRQRFNRAAASRQTRLILAEAHVHEIEILDMIAEEEMAREAELRWNDPFWDDDVLAGQVEPISLSLLDVMPLWEGAECICGHGPEMHHAHSRMCADRTCHCYGFEVWEDPHQPLYERQLARQFGGLDLYSGSIWDRYDQMFDE